MICFLRGCRWSWLGSFGEYANESGSVHLWGCRRCQRVKVQFFKPEAGR
jgi:hypothetical protein